MLGLKEPAVSAGRGDVAPLQDLPRLALVGGTHVAIVVGPVFGARAPAVFIAVAAAPGDRVVDPLADLGAELGDDAGAAGVVDDALLDRGAAVVVDQAQPGIGSSGAHTVQPCTGTCRRPKNGPVECKWKAKIPAH
jgi:hypothetical protein